VGDEAIVRIGRGRPARVDGSPVAEPQGERLTGRFLTGRCLPATAYPPDELRQLVERAGFEILDVDEVKAEAELNRLEVQIYLRATGI
jgi:hypothetical protein